MNARPLFLAGLIAAAAAARLLPHPDNVTPVAAIALFAGARFADKRMAFLVPLAAMFLSDLVLGLYPLLPVIYGSLALIVGLGFLLRRRESAARIAGAGLAGAVLFFLITNFAVWAVPSGTLYPKTAAGLLDCYAAGLPFFRNEVLGTAFYTLVLFGGCALAERRFAPLRETATATA